MNTMTRGFLIAGSALAILAGCTDSGGSAAAADPTTPGATGRTIVRGTNSTIAGDAAATDSQRKWPLGGIR